MNNPQTPLEKLISDKQIIVAKCKQHEQKLNEEFSYIQENAGSLLLAGLSSVLFSGPKQPNKGQEGKTASSTTEPSPNPLGITEYFSIAKGLLPVAWEIVQPIIMTWGINKAKKWFFRHLFKKKK